MTNIVLYTKEEYTLLARVKENKVYEYVVAWLLEENGTWASGTYVNDLQVAMKILENKVSGEFWK